MNAKNTNALRRRAPRGQGMTEYIIVVALIAIAAIGVITVFGDNIRQLFGASANALGGSTAASTNLRNANTQMGNKKLTDFGASNY